VLAGEGRAGGDAADPLGQIAALHRAEVGDVLLLDLRRAGRSLGHGLGRPSAYRLVANNESLYEQQNHEGLDQ
jgi:hypothetical protein